MSSHPATSSQRADDASVSAEQNLPAFLITIDTEGDNLWAAPREITTENSRYLARFQSLCERYALRPTYLTNWEMARCPVYVDFARDLLARGTGEVGMHLHAWNNPPLVPLTSDDYHWRPYLIEYPESVMRDKIAAITDLLRSTFAEPVVSHRAGRWALNAIYARQLVEQDYRVDCSATPLVSWQQDRGAPQGTGGVDYRDVPGTAFWLDPTDILRPGVSELLEVPMTIVPGTRRSLLSSLRPFAARLPLGRRLLDRCCPEVHWFRPNRRNGATLRSILDRVAGSDQDYVEMMLHSSELMPGGSPYFPDARSIERLYDDLERLFAASRGRFCGMTLQQYYNRVARRAGRAARCVPCTFEPGRGRPGRA